MDDDSQEDKINHSTYSKHRSPTFSHNESKMLLEMIDKYKSVILNKSTNSAMCHAKEVTWTKIAQIFNSKGFKHERTSECLKYKWFNLKRDAKRMSKNLLDMGHNEFDDVTSKTVALMCQAENITNTAPLDLDGEVNESAHQNQTQLDNWCGGEDGDAHDNDGDNIFGDNESKRSMNFSPQECNLLIRCVRQEKKYVLTKSTTSGANKLKNRAWLRVTKAFNKLSPQKRSTKVLRTKFVNMKRMAKHVNFKHCFKVKKNEKLIDISVSDNKIKIEPVFEDKDLSEPEDDHDDVDVDEDVDVDDNHSKVIKKTIINTIPDPLSTGLNGDSGIDIINPLENKEIVRLKTELLHYKMETAKLERKRIEEALKAQALENALRLRTARLEAVAAADKLLPAHPALGFPVEEAHAQLYLTQCT